MDDVFSATFQSLKARILEGPQPLSHSSTHAVPPIPFAQSSQSNTNTLLTHSAGQQYSEETRKTQRRLRELREKKEAKVKNIKKQLIENEEILNMMLNNQVVATNSCQKHFNYTLKQLHNQNSLAERRMRELVFEVMGEYGKCMLRSKRRHAYLRCSYRIHKSVAICEMRWNYFMARLLYETLQQQQLENTNKFGKYFRLNMQQYNIVCPQKCREEYLCVKKVACSVLSSISPKDVMVSMVMKYVTPDISREAQQRGPATTPRGGRRPTRTTAPVIATSVHDLKKLVHEARRYINMGQSGGGKTSKQTHQAQTHTVSASAFISASCIEWLRPCSYNAISADTLASIFSYVPSAKSSSFKQSRDGLVSTMATPNQFDSFSNRFISQHGARPSSTYVYFCLEERAGSGVLENFPRSKDTRRAEEAECSPFLVTQYLQRVYCSGHDGGHDGNDFFMTENNNGDEYENNDASNLTSTEALRAAMGEGGAGNLLVLDSLGVHRRLDKINKSFVAEQLSVYPDVLKVVNVKNGKIFHFAPALTSTLPEVQEYNKLGSAGATAATAVSILHPHQQYLSSPSSLSPLQHLYCLAVVPTPSSSLSKEAAAITNILDSVGGPKTDQSFCKVFLPLSAPCERELIRHYFFPATSSKQSDMATCMESNNHGSSFEFQGRGSLDGPARATCIDLLPDHPMQRVDASSKDSLLLRNAYMLVGSEVFEDLAGQSFNEKNSNANNGDGQKKETGFYIIQYNEMNASYEEGHVELQGEGGGGAQIGDNEVLMHLMRGHIDGLGRTEGGGKADKKNSVGAPPSDVPLLSTVCRWRSCLSEACAESGTKYLCSYHQVLKDFLDGPDNNPQQGGGKSKKNSVSANNVKESSKYISKKAIMNYSSDTINRDLKIMRNASTLIQELWDGKLAATVQSFAQKTCVDIGIRKRLESSYKICTKYAKKQLLPGFPHPLLIPSRPDWARWRNEREFERIGGLIGTAYDVLQMILSTEREIYQELEILASLKIFPAPELFVIRKETKHFRETQGRIMSDYSAGNAEDTELDSDGNKLGDASLEAELSLCDRKLAVFRTRRLDAEEARSQHKKKAAKLKMLQESQAKDPSNFGNQTRF